MKAEDMHRKILEREYKGTCVIYEYGKEKDKISKLNRMAEKVVSGEQPLPCKLSFSNSPAAEGNGAAVTRQQSVKLFLSPDITVKPGSKIVVTQNDIIQAYKNSGTPAVYATHQEITLELFERWT